MTRPIYEPSLQRTDRRLRYGTDQLFRRPARSGFDVPYMWMRWVGTEAVTVDTLTVVSALAPYEESFIYDPDGQAGFAADLTSGIGQWTEPGEYHIQCSVEFDGSATAGSTLGSVINMGEDGVFATFRVVNIIIADGINETMHIPVTWSQFDFGSDFNSVEQRCYHNDAGGQSLGRADMHIWQVNPSTAGVFDPP